MNTPVLDWLYLTIELLAVVGAEGGVKIVGDSNPRGRIVSVFLTRIRTVAWVVRTVSMLVVDQALVKRRQTAR